MPQVSTFLDYHSVQKESVRHGCYWPRPCRYHKDVLYSIHIPFYLSWVYHNNQVLLLPFSSSTTPSFLTIFLSLLGIHTPPLINLHLLILTTAEDAQLIPHHAEHLAPVARHTALLLLALLALAIDHVHGFADAAHAALVLGRWPDRPQIPDPACPVVRARNQRVLVLRVRRQADHLVSVPTQRHDARRGRAGARVDEGNVSGGGAAGEKGRRGRGARQGREREERMRGCEGADHAGGGQVDGLDGMVLRHGVGDGAVAGVEDGGRGGRIVDVHEGERAALGGGDGGRELAALGCVGAGKKRGIGDFGRGRLGGGPETNGAVGGGSEDALRGAVNLERVDRGGVAVQFEDGLQLAAALVRLARLGVLPYANCAVHAGRGDLSAGEEFGGFYAGSVTTMATRGRGANHVSRGVPYPEETVVGGREDAVLAALEVVAGPAARRRSSGKNIDGADPIVVLKAGLVCWWDQTANVLKGDVGFERETIGVEVLFKTAAEEAAVNKEVEGDRVGVEHGLGVENTGKAITADVGGDKELALALIELDVLLLGGEGHPDLGA